MRPGFRIRIVLAATAAAWLLCAVRAPLRACLWDSDTLRAEAKGMPDVIRVIAGRFERNPPLYYEMRLERASARIESVPDDLAAYDDAGVSCDRLGRGEEAIDWMTKKRARLDAAEARGENVADARYRYLANLGTFEVHRWFRDGGDPYRLPEVESARDHIAQAIALNPKAHFGREPYQLKILEWIIHPPRFDPEHNFALPTLVHFGPNGAKDEPHAAVEALTGLIALGNAWKSVDVFNALIVALDADGGRTYVETLAQWRCLELIDAGKSSIVAGAPKGSKLRDIISEPTSMPQGKDDLKRLYQTLRDEAESWHSARTAYMTERLKKGSHPDTDPHFWDDYHDPGPPSLDVERRLLSFVQVPPPYEPSFIHRLNPVSVALIGFGALGGGAAIVLRRRRGIARKPSVQGGFDDLA